ncbi:hypothetical protein PILCRDRAFT_164510 [Piloderma croceum F 1598]|uniref:Uncharacterized protein n=1 Tax=Piloderma croceum (strain F 1598) TaxID=765440 RepID=A0A0C3GKI3_PILCF|nr:hypothetical protein PILCRDRAFT_164510 [Piloderma croceum F 1598]
MHHVQYQELPSKFFEAGGTDVLNTFIQYAAYELNCCTSYRMPRDPRANLLKTTAQIRARSTYEVRTSALAGNPSDCLELGLRMWTGCSAEQVQWFGGGRLSILFCLAALPTHLGTFKQRCYLAWLVHFSNVAASTQLQCNSTITSHHQSSYNCRTVLRI